MKNSITVIVPVHNEESTVEETILSILELKKIINLQLVVVNNNSTDQTNNVLKKLSKTCKFQLLNISAKGKGIAVRKGLEIASGNIISIIDADNEYNPKDLLTLIKSMEENNHRFILGNRYANKTNIRNFKNSKIKTRYYNTGHILFTKYFNFIFGTKIEDPATMWKIFYLADVKDHKLSGSGFEFDWEILALLIRKNILPIELGAISYQSRDHSEGKKIKSFKDPLKWIFYIFYYRFKKFKLLDGVN